MKLIRLIHDGRRLTMTSKQVTRNLNTELAEKELTGATKSFNDIPSAKEALYKSTQAFQNDDPSYLHEQCEYLHKVLGPIFRKHLGPYELVFIADTNLIQTVIHNEGPYPHHSVPPCWTYYNEVHNIKRGVFFQTGEPWARLRRPLAEVLLRNPRSITRFAYDIININNDMMREWCHRSSNGQIILKDVKRELCRWSIEATGYMLFGTRMGCILTNDNHSNHKKAEQLVDSITEMFTMTSFFQTTSVEQEHKLDTVHWRHFDDSMSKMLDISNLYAQELIAKAKSAAQGSSLICDILSMDKFSDDELRASVIDLIIASADTTSTSLQWMIYLLSKDQEVQAKIFEESKLLLEPTTDLHNYRESAPYTFNFIRETLRLYPTAPFLARTLNQDILLNNYRVPAGTPIVFSLYTTSRMNRYFDKPFEFIPERWSRQNRECPFSRVTSNASLPFGIGRRMCIGKRMAELQMCLLLSSFTATFRSYPIDEDIKIKLTMTLGPDKPITIKLKSR